MFKVTDTSQANPQDLNELYEAAAKGDFRTCSYLIANGANVDERTPDVWRWTPLMIAVLEEHQDICDLLLQNEANINAVDSQGCSSLSIAVADGKLEMCQFLVERGADVNVEHLEGDSPLSIAEREGLTEICDYLIANDAVKKNRPRPSF